MMHLCQNEFGDEMKFGVVLESVPPFIRVNSNNDK